jgi:hypothetical protein
MSDSIPHCRTCRCYTPVKKDSQLISEACRREVNEHLTDVTYENAAIMLRSILWSFVLKNFPEIGRMEIKEGNYCHANGIDFCVWVETDAYKTFPLIFG